LRETSSDHRAGLKSAKHKCKGQWLPRYRVRQGPRFLALSAHYPWGESAGSTEGLQHYAMAFAMCICFLRKGFLICQQDFADRTLIKLSLLLLLIIPFVYISNGIPLPNYPIYPPQPTLKDITTFICVCVCVLKF
jgi:hypothetical protein